MAFRALCPMSEVFKTDFMLQRRQDEKQDGTAKCFSRAMQLMCVRPCARVCGLHLKQAAWLVYLWLCLVAVETQPLNFPPIFPCPALAGFSFSLMRISAFNISHCCFSASAPAPLSLWVCVAYKYKM